ncbi:MAG: DUF3656 domain-containing protein [Akkermansiaceae bacterium]|nr:DUF3656 domain-containing protein [Akkermansiaceae bacterium]
MPAASSTELLAPAGNWECVFAAAAGGADAVYFGLDRFNARMRADNFTREDLPALIPFLHDRGMKAYVTMNVLIFPSETQEALDCLCELASAGVDGVIVQDAGLASLIRRVPELSGLELHISTQMTVTSPEAVRFAERALAPVRIVLARELSLKEIAACAAAAAAAQIEVFVHGALCVSYSGQCLTSESLGLRSANRGECAQACRMPYRLEVDGAVRSLGGRRYLMSPQDLCALGRIPELLEAGALSFKIEGRLKSPQYVLAASSAYRKALDAARDGRALPRRLHDALLYDMQMTFSRGFWTGWLDGPNHPGLTHGRFGKKRGILAGRIRAAGNGWIELDEPPPFPAVPGDGFVVDCGDGLHEEQGGRIWKAEGARLHFHGRASHIDWAAVKPGHLLWKTDDPALDARLARAWRNFSRPGRRISLCAKGVQDGPLTVSCEGLSVRSSTPLRKALRHPLTVEVFLRQFGRLGNTGFELGESRFDVPDGLMLPLSELNRMRRELVALLERKRGRGAPHAALPELVFPAAGSRREGVPRLCVLCRAPAQAEALAAVPGVSRIYLDFPRLGELLPCMKTLRKTASGKEIFIATLRVLKPGETGCFRFIERAEPDGVLVRNMGAAEYFRRSPFRLAGDFSLNVSNPYAVQFWLEQGLETLTASYDLNAGQLVGLLRCGAAPHLELTLHQHMPLFHMEHCLFCCFLSKGSSFVNCGRPCERHRVRVIDRTGAYHFLQSDEGCRNTLFNGRAQSGARFVPQMLREGMRCFRVELLEESPREAVKLVSLYVRLLAGEISADELIARLEPLDRLGVTEGTLRAPHPGAANGSRARKRRR